MDSNFQTSFIPKKPIVEKRATSTHSIGFFTVISIFILFTVLLASLALFFYKTVLTKNIAQMEKDLNLAKNRFEPSKIKELQVLDKRINSSNEILTHHIAVTPIFQALQLLTMKSVRYTKFDYSLEDGKDPKIIVKMSGQALGYSSIALQSDLFAKNKNLIDPVFSNLSLDDKGNILFDLEFLVDYKQTLLAQS